MAQGLVLVDPPPCLFQNSTRGEILCMMGGRVRGDVLLRRVDGIVEQDGLRLGDIELSGLIEVITGSHDPQPKVKKSTAAMRMRSSRSRPLPEHAQSLPPRKEGYDARHGQDDGVAAGEVAEPITGRAGEHCRIVGHPPG